LRDGKILETYIKQEILEKITAENDLYKDNLKIGMVYSASISYEIGGGIPHEFFELHTPLGIAYPIAMLKSKYPEICVKIIDQAYLKASNEMILEILKKEKLDLIGFSSYCWNSQSILFWIKKIKKINPSIKILIGGPQFSAIAKSIMEKYHEIDFIIIKEGEIPFLKLVEKLLSNDENYDDVPSLVYRDENTVIQNDELIPPVNLDEYPSPYLTGILDNYLDGKTKYLGLQTSRGCPFNCSYCVWNQQSTFKDIPKIRYFSIKRVIKELQYIKNKLQKPWYIEIYDATFNEDSDRLREIAETIIKNNLKMKFGVRIRVDLLNDEQIELLKKMGVWVVRIGIESIGDSLKTVHRSQHFEKTKNNIKKLKKAGIFISGNLMIGLPNQSKNEIMNTLNFVKNLNVDSFTINVYDIPTGTEIYNNFEKYGIKILNRLDDGRLIFETNELKRNDIIKLARMINFKLNSIIINPLKIYKKILAFS